MIAYRRTEHETTGLTPNILMLGHEVTTSLNLIYEMPTTLKKIPSVGLRFTRTFRKCPCYSLKEYRNVSRDKCKFMISVVHLKRFKHVIRFMYSSKWRTSSKFTSFWRGHFTVFENIWEVLNKVDCGRNKVAKVIHCNRFRKQLLKKM